MNIQYWDLIDYEGARNHLLISKYGGFGFWVERFKDGKVILKEKCKARRRAMDLRAFNKFSAKHELSFVSVN